MAAARALRIASVVSSAASMSCLVLTGIFTWNEPTTYRSMLTGSRSTGSLAAVVLPRFLLATSSVTILGGSGTGGCTRPTARVPIRRTTTLNSCPFTTVAGRSIVRSPARLCVLPPGMGTYVALLVVVHSTVCASGAESACDPYNRDASATTSAASPSGQ